LSVADAVWCAVPAQPLTELSGAEAHSTIEPDDLSDLKRDGRRVALTILCHADLQRIGEQALLEQPARISRLEPRFSVAVPAIRPPEPLSDPSVSRKPIDVEIGPTHVTLTPSGEGIHAIVNGTPFDWPRTFDHAKLDDGVVIELGQWTAVLLHSVVPGAALRPAYGLVGESAAIRALRMEIARVADLDVPVLLRGETGTGKELVARALHDAGPRSRGPCVAVNLGAVPAATAVSQLFGHTKGAFSGATSDHEGYFGDADGGTLFLDEIGEAGVDVQVMLLRALENGEIQPLGPTRPRRVDIRLVTATDTDLEEAARAGKFRPALLHRLTAYQIAIPPLRHRKDDVPHLLLHFLRDELARVGEQERLTTRRAGKPGWLPASLIARLCRYAWPGNVRELRNVVRRLVVASRGSDVASAAAIDELISPRAPAGTAQPEPVAPARTSPAAITEEQLVDVLRTCAWAPGAAAERLGISRTTLDGLIARSPRIRKAHMIPADELQTCLDECGGDEVATAARLEVSHRALVLRLRQLGVRR
jgi:two-component system, NtrC family, nitrogen regulation response regulator GlnG